VAEEYISLLGLNKLQSQGTFVTSTEVGYSYVIRFLNGNVFFFYYSFSWALSLPYVEWIWFVAGAHLSICDIGLGWPHVGCHSASTANN